MPFRTKTVTYDGISHKIAALSFDQCAELVTPDKSLTASTDPTEKTRAVEVRTRDILRASFKNAGEEKEWTDAAFNSEMDQWLQEKLCRDILEYTGYKVAPMGETPATPAS